MINFSLLSIDMLRSHGYGQYNIVVEFLAYNEKHRLTFHSTDSQLWDNDEKTVGDLLNHIGGEQALLDRI